MTTPATPGKKAVVARADKSVALLPNSMIQLSSLTPSSHRNKYKRVGRGNSSGKGTTAGRGTKGQRARTGGRNKLTRRSLKSLILPTPKLRGFVSHKPDLFIVSLGQLQASFPDGATVNAQELVKKNLIDAAWPGVKVLGGGTVSKKFIVTANGFSKSAAAAITKAGGTVTAINKPTRTLLKKEHSKT
jgi:large subunit ribosomal protein L15